MPWGKKRHDENNHKKLATTLASTSTSLSTHCIDKLIIELK
jgi:hypothetical protein